jgi:putative membrane protein
MNRTAIIILSVLVPVIVATLFFTIETASDALWIRKLPLLNAVINGTSAIILVLAVFYIKNGNENAHKRLMKVAFILGVLFMLSYVTYHASVPSTKFGDINGDAKLQASELAEISGIRTVYLALLLSHILMAVIALPLILTAFVYGLKDKRDKHRKIVRYTFPVWLYVSITGVLVYILISPYY